MKFFLPLFFLISMRLSAQTDYYRRNVTSIHVTQSWMPTSRFKNSAYEYALPQSNLSFVVPLIQKRHDHNTTGIPSYKRLQLQGGILFSPLTLSSLAHKHSFFQPSIGLGGAWYKGNRNLFSANIAAMISEDNYSFLKPQLRGKGSIIYKRLPSPKGNFSFLAGIGYSYIFGSGRIFPILGIKGCLNKARTLKYDIIFPTHTKLLFTPNTKQTYTAFLRLNGNAYRFSNQDSSVNMPNIAIFRNRELQAGLSAGYAFSPQFKLNLEVGGLFLRKIGISDARKRGQKVNYYFTDNPKIVPFVKLGIDIYLQEGKQSDDVQWEYKN